MNDFLKKQGIALAIQFIGVLVMVLLAYGALKQDNAVQDQKILSQQQQLDAASIRITAAEVRLQNTASAADINSLKADIRGVNQSINSLAIGLGVKGSQ